MVNVGWVPIGQPGFEEFRQPLDLVSHWLTGFANCTPPQEKMTNAGSTFLSKTPAANITALTIRQLCLTNARLVTVYKNKH